MKNAEEQLIQIGDLAEQLGITARTIRYYEEIGLLESPRRLEHGVRVYDTASVARLKFILKLKELGLSLKEMQELADIYREQPAEEQIFPRLIEILDGHIRRVDDKMSTLASLRSDIADYRQRVIGRMNAQESA